MGMRCLKIMTTVNSNTPASEVESSKVKMAFK